MEILRKTGIGFNKYIIKYCTMFAGFGMIMKRSLERAVRKDEPYFAVL